METYQHDFSRLKQAFVGFLQNLPFYGSAILCTDDANVRSIMPLVSKPIVTYGLREDAQVRAADIVSGERMHFRAIRDGAAALDINLNLPGRHNVQNALAAIAVATEVGVSDPAIRQALAEFHGVTLAGGGSYALVDDYGHHPVEMRATLEAARDAFPGRRIVLAFQPHRYTRTRDLFEDFVKTLSGVDALLLAEVYPAGEAPIAGADGRSLARALRLAGKTEPVFVGNIAELPGAIGKVVRAGDVVVTMGAGSIGSIPALLAKGGAR
jgi:UDP-N-acetylmuramate--alanine ligase